MKRYYTRLVAVMLGIFATAGLVSCSSDDDDDKTSLETPKYESVSARYDIESAGTDIKSIELTASGNYIILKNDGYYARTKDNVQGRKASFIAKAAAMTRAYERNIIYGKYTKISDTEFELEGWGTIVITGSADNALSLTLTPTGGETVTVTAAKHTQNPSSTLTEQICRTWSIASLRFAITLNNKNIFDKEYKMSELKNIASDMRELSKKYNFDDEDDDDDDWDEDEYWDEEDMERAPKQLIFTKAGTYMVLYQNNELAVSTWTWENESKGVLRYSWDYDNMYSDWGSGTVNVSFRGNQLVFTEDIDEEDYDEDDIPSSMTISYYLDEVK